MKVRNGSNKSSESGRQIYIEGGGAAYRMSLPKMICMIQAVVLLWMKIIDGAMVVNTLLKPRSLDHFHCNLSWFLGVRLHLYWLGPRFGHYFYQIRKRGANGAWRGPVNFCLVGFGKMAKAGVQSRGLTRCSRTTRYCTYHIIRSSAMPSLALL